MRLLIAATLALATNGVGFASGSPAAAQAPAEAQVTWAKDVAPIVQRSCQGCHRPGAVAPMSLLTYEDARPWARSIRNRVAAREMPPWHIDRHLGIRKFKNDQSLTDAQIATITKWVDSGAPRGNPAAEPPPRDFSRAREWGIGTPDVIVNFPGYALPPGGPDVLLNLLVDPGFKQDMWVQAAEVKPADPASFEILHHLSANLVLDPREDPIGGQIAFYNHGRLAERSEELPPDAALGMLIPAGAHVNWNVHLTPKGKPVNVGIQLGLKLLPKGTIPHYQAVTLGVGSPPNDELDIPPGEISRHDGYTRLEKPALVLSFQSHMHYRGAAQCVNAIYPPDPDARADSHRLRSETLSCVSQYDQGWQLTYTYADDVAPLLCRHGYPSDLLARQHGQQQVESEPEELGRLGSADR